VSLDPSIAKVENNLSKRSGSADGSYAGTKNLAAAWIPDYTLVPLTDILYLEIRRKTYLSAVKATRMYAMHRMEGGFNDREIDSYLERVSEDDTDFMRTPSLRSPDRNVDGGAGFTESGSTTPQLRRESMRNSLSMLKAKFLGGDRGSMDRSNGSKDEFWDGVANDALDTEEGPVLNVASSAPDKIINGPTSIPLVKTNTATKRELDQDNAQEPTGKRFADNSHAQEPTGKRFADNNRSNEEEKDQDKGVTTNLEGVAVLGNNTTVISVKSEDMTPVEAQNTGNTTSPSDRTSLLRNDSTTS
jgi:hypothetical protein